MKPGRGGKGFNLGASLGLALWGKHFGTYFELWLHPLRREISMPRRFQLQSSDEGVHSVSTT